MTDLIAAKVIATTSSAIVLGAGFVAVLDPAITNIALAVIAAVVALTPVVFAFKTAALTKKLADAEKKLEMHDIKIADVVKTSDGMKTELVHATAIASRAEGIVAGLAQAEGKAAIVAAAKAEGREEQNDPRGAVRPPTSPPAPGEPIVAVENTRAVRANTVAVKENTAKQ